MAQQMKAAHTMCQTFNQVQLKGCGFEGEDASQ
jgi:hypothetical protein